MKKISSLAAAFIFIICIIISGCTKKETPVPYMYLTDLRWPVTNSLSDNSRRLEFRNYKKNKVKEVTAEDTAKNVKIVTAINKEGFPVSSSTYFGGVLREQSIYEYDSKGIVTKVTVKGIPPENPDSAKNSPKKYYNIVYSYKDGVPYTINIKDSNTNYNSEAIYEGGKLRKIKNETEGFGSKLSTSREVSYSGDTVKITEDGSPAVYYTKIITGKDTVYTYGEDGDKKRIYKDGRIIFQGNETMFIKYFYKENGLTDYTIERWSTDPKYVFELTMVNKYSFYEN
jgi:hypothetical protein